MAIRKDRPAPLKQRAAVQMSRADARASPDSSDIQDLPEGTVYSPGRTDWMARPYLPITVDFPTETRTAHLKAQMEDGATMAPRDRHEMAAFPWSLSEIESRVRAGELSPDRLVQTSLDAIDSLEPSIQAWSWLVLQSAQTNASALTEEVCRTGSRGPLHGVPIAVKDIFDTAGIPTEWGTETQRGRVPESNSDLVSKLLSLGCVLMGKTHTTAYAYFDTGPTRNPHNWKHTPGGSSSGSAAAVAAGTVPLAIGSQTQGSVVRPASFCGVTGFKPSYGLLPLGGVMAFAPTLDHAGLFASTVSDIRVAWKALGFAIEAAPAGAITVLDWPPRGRVEPAMAMAFRSAVQSLCARGLRVERVARPAFFDVLPAALHTVMASEAAREHGNRYRLHGRRMGAKLAELLDEGLRIGPAEYQAARQTLEEVRGAFSSWAATHSVVATPAAPGPAPHGLQSSGDPCCNAPFTALGAPAISVPMPVNEYQLPMGLQLAAARGCDAKLLATADACRGVFREGD